MTVESFIEAFTEGKLGKKTVEGQWRVQKVDNQVDYYFTGKESGITKLVFTGHVQRRVGYGWQRETVEEKETVAYRFPDGTVIYNANVLDVAVRKAWGNARHDQGRSDCQIILDNAGAKPIPFSLFEESGMSLDDAIMAFKWVVKPVAESLKRRHSENKYVGTNVEGADAYGRKTVFFITTEHFAGRAIYAVGEKYFLFDVDRKEQEENGIFNPFVVELPGPAASFEEAYAMLMPQKVREAIEAGVPVQRQGEFFFLKYSDEIPVKIELTDEEKHILRYPPSKMGFFLTEKYGRGVHWVHDDRDPIDNPKTPEEIAYNEAATRYRDIRRRVDDAIPEEVNIDARLGTGGTGRHKASVGIRDASGELYVSGTVVHSGREHGDLHLEGWWTVVPNTAVKSVTIQGKID